jgi:tetratricopeptide (TPR) repeat protein
VAVDAHLARSDEIGARDALWLGLARWPEDRDVARRLGEALQRVGDAPGMRRFARQVLEHRRGSAEIHFLLGSWAEARARRGDAARAFARCAKADPSDAEPVVRLARIQRGAGRADLAERAVSAALQRIPKAAELHAALGYARIDAGRPADAAEAFARAVELAPDWLVYREDLAGAWLLAERWREAAAEAQRAAKAEPKSARAWSALAVSLGHLGKRDQSDQAFRRALALSGEQARVQGNYGLFLRRDPARLLEAARHLRAALEAHPDWAEVREALAALGRG